MEPNLPLFQIDTGGEHNNAGKEVIVIGIVEVFEGNITIEVVDFKVMY